MVAATRRPATGTTSGVVWYCAGATCRRYLGRIVDGALIEPNRAVSALPVVRYCPNCKKRNVRLS
jgi:hypothetical protein